MKKRLVTLLLATMMATSTLVGCGFSVGTQAGNIAVSDYFDENDITNYKEVIKALKLDDTASSEKHSLKNGDGSITLKIDDETYVFTVEDYEITEVTDSDDKVVWSLDEKEHPDFEDPDYFEADDFDNFDDVADALDLDEDDITIMGTLDKKGHGTVIIEEGKNTYYCDVENYEITEVTKGKKVVWTAEEDDDEDIEGHSVGVTDDGDDGEGEEALDDDTFTTMFEDEDALKINELDYSLLPPLDDSLTVGQTGLLMGYATVIVSKSQGYTDDDLEDMKDITESDINEIIDYDFSDKEWREFYKYYKIGVDNADLINEIICSSPEIAEAYEGLELGDTIEEKESTIAILMMLGITTCYTDMDYNFGDDTGSGITTPTLSNSGDWVVKGNSGVIATVSVPSGYECTYDYISDNYTTYTFEKGKNEFNLSSVSSIGSLIYTDADEYPSEYVTTVNGVEIRHTTRKSGYNSYVAVIQADKYNYWGIDAYDTEMTEDEFIRIAEEVFK